MAVATSTGGMNPTTSTTNTSVYHVVVIVLGDLGRSPRMQYHVQSLLEAGHRVTFVGYTGEDLIPTLANNRRFQHRLHVVRFKAPMILKLKQVSLALHFLWRIVSLSLLLVYNLLFRVQNQSGVDLVLIQNPPALPLLAVSVLYSRFYVKAPLVVDWHNLGFSMLPESSKLLRQLGEWYERQLCPYAQGHLTVTKALQEFLIEEFHLLGKIPESGGDNGGSGADGGKVVDHRYHDTSHKIGVLMDCPPAMFRSRTVKEQHQLLQKVDAQLCAACPQSWSAFKDPAKQTLFTEQMEGTNRFRWRKHRPALMTSATSWTKDEDMGLLLEALQLLDKRIATESAASSSPSSPSSPTAAAAYDPSTLKVLCVITGKGPLKANCELQLTELAPKLVHVAVTTLWLSPEDYPKWLACADLGVSLHTSTSGRDLPIKILDYFGCEVPVAAYNFPCLYELVQDDVNGRVFTTQTQLADCLYQLLEPLSSSSTAAAAATATTTSPDNNSVDSGGDGGGGVANHDFGDLKRYSLQVQGKLLWGTNWTKNAWPVMEAAIRNYATVDDHATSATTNAAATTAAADNDGKHKNKNK